MVRELVLEKVVATVFVLALDLAQRLVSKLAAHWVDYLAGA
jgi:hypothetical protein